MKNLGFVSSSPEAWANIYSIFCYNLPMEVVRSRENKRVKVAKKLLQKKYRDQAGLYLIEGFHLLEEAIKSKKKILDVFLLEGKGIPGQVKEVIWVSQEVLASLAETNHPQGVIAVIQKEALDLPTKGRFLVLEDIQDPGNVGTMVRTADAAGFDGVICLGETADIYNPKVLRSAQGSHFHLPILKADQMPYLGVPILATSLGEHSKDYRDVKEEAFALVMGNEGGGISDEIFALADQCVHIPMAGQAESLNVAVAAGILMFGMGGGPS